VPQGNGQASPPKQPLVRVRKPAPEEPEEYGEQDEVDHEEIEQRPVVRKRRRPPSPEDDDEPDDEEEERPLPRKRRKSKKKKPPNRIPLVLGLVIGGVLLVGAAGVTLAVVFWPKDKSTSVAQNNPPTRPSRMPGGAPGGAGAADEKSTSPAGRESESRTSEPGSDSGSDPYAAGKQVFQRSCARCHRIGSEGRGGQGPDLTTIGRTRDADWLMGFIRDPQSRKPNSRMRPQRLSDEDLRAVAVYLASLK
jgi:mono/diheme cytochrome c family protein